MAQETLLQLKNVSVHYGGVHALTDVSIDLDENEIVALMGPNGAGKSTILKAIFGLAPIKKGKVLWHERAFKPVTHEVVERGIAFVPQGRRVFRSLTVEENLEIGGITVKDDQERQRRIAEVMETFPVLKQKRKAKSGSLSGGQQQMLAMARGLMLDPKVLLLDEPSLGLSPKLVTEVFEKVREIKEKHNTAILIVEHNLKSLVTIADRAYVLSKGHVRYSGDTQRLIQEGVLQRIFLE